MPKSTGEVRAYHRTDGSTTYSLRFRARGRRQIIKLGTDTDGWTDARARRELAKHLALVTAGLWEPPREKVARDDDELFHVAATRWLAEKEIDLRPSSIADLRWRLECHLLPYFASIPARDIDPATVDAYKLHKQQKRRHIKDAIDSGHPPRDTTGRPVKALSNESINKTLRTLGEILEYAHGPTGHTVQNPVRRRGVLLKVPKPRRDFLEPDELVESLEAASALDGPSAHTLARAQEARRLRDIEGRPWSEVAASLGVAVSTAVYLHRRPDRAEVPHPRRAILATLGCSGLRASELCALDWHDTELDRGVIHLRDAKTPAGIRDVYITPWLGNELATYRAALEGAIDHRQPAFATRTGGRRDRHNLLGRVVAPAVREANRERATQGRTPLPAVTNHTFRRTYISLLFAAGAEPPYVMSQVGHEDAKTTLNIYAQVVRQRDRTGVGEAFDRRLNQPPTQREAASRLRRRGRAVPESQAAAGGVSRRRR